MKYWEYILSIPKSFFFCVKCLPLSNAVQLPIIVRYNVVVKSVGEIKLCGSGFGHVRIGFGEVGIFDKNKERTIWDSRGDVVFRGKGWIGMGSRIVVGDKARLLLGENFVCTASMSLICFKAITIGKETLISWGTMIMDTDFHHIYHDEVRKSSEKAIHIGNHVWIGCRSIILKGTEIKDDCVIAAGSVVVNYFKENNVLIAGNPASIRKIDVSWTEH